MNITNNSGLPDALVSAVRNDSYTKGDSDFSVTELISPARIGALRAKHSSEIEVDAEDMLWSLYGQVAHSILERANKKALAEKRYYAIINNAKVSGQIDTLDLDAGVLSDWKFSTSYKFKVGAPPPDEWVMQLNFQLELLRQNGLDASRLQIIGLLRDFSKMEAKREQDYPKSPVVVMPIPMWHRGKTQAVMAERVAVHRAARESLPLCTNDERWAKPTVYAVKKKDQKRAVRVYGTYDEALVHASSAPGLTVEKRPGSYTRCEYYCQVRPFCAQANEGVEI